MGTKVAPALVLVAALLSACGSDEPVASASTGRESTEPIQSASATPGPIGASSAKPTPSAKSSASSATGTRSPAGSPSSTTTGSSDRPRPATPKPAVTPKPTGNLKPATPVPQQTVPPVEIDEPAETATGVQVKLESWEPVTIQAGSPGEIGGPGVAVTIRVMNDSDTALDLGNVVADLRYGEDLTPAIRSDRSPTVPFAGTLDIGDQATATYAFRIDKADREQVELLLSLGSSVPVVVFVGSVA